ncbi:MAG: AIR synthase-related protein [Candidatus Bathyarchaeia archaeon]
MKSKYEELGVDVKKKGIEVFQKLTANLFPDAFCVVTRDPEKESTGLVLHTDSAGTKAIVCYLLWRESGSPEAFKGLAQDVLAMNLDDIVCVGATPFSFVDYVAVNGFRVPKEDALRALSEGFREIMIALKEQGLPLMFAGGETADLPDLVRTIDISATALGRVPLSRVVAGDRMKPGDLIVGLRSGGRAAGEARENSGLMCNGLTLARRSLLHQSYGLRFPESWDGTVKTYSGRFSLSDEPEGLGMTLGEALTSPKRVYAPYVLKVLERFGSQITGLVHNTGGGLTKCLKLGRGLHYVKDRLYEPDPIFKLIKEESGEDWRNMYEAFNMGVGFEVITEHEAAERVVEALESMGLEAKVIGEIQRSEGGNRLTIRSPFGEFKYPADGDSAVA